ncbi:hypothetical protein Vafri_16018, partial [Volvox africanus]
SSFPSPAISSSPSPAISSPSPSTSSSPSPATSPSPDSAIDNRRLVSVLAVLKYLAEFVAAARALEHAEAGHGRARPAALVAAAKPQLLDEVQMQQEPRAPDAVSGANHGSINATLVHGEAVKGLAAATMTVPVSAAAATVTVAATVTMMVTATATESSVKAPATAPASAVGENQPQPQHQGVPAEFLPGVQLPLPDGVAGAVPVAAVESRGALRALQPLMQRGRQSAAVLMEAAERALACR